MRILRPLVVLMAALVVAGTGCSSITVNHDFDSTANFGMYKTYGWLLEPVAAVGDARAAQQMNTLLDKRIRTAVDQQLAAKGMMLVTEDPDAQVVYHLGIDKEIDVQSWGYTYPRYPYGAWHGGRVDVYEYNVGTLIVDIIDAKSDQLIWRGTATKVIDESATAGEREANLNEVIAKILVGYPPK